MDTEFFKDLLGDIPGLAELYWRVRQPGQPVSPKFSFDQLQAALPAWRTQAAAALALGPTAKPTKNIFIFGVLRWWIEHTALLSAALAGQGHAVTFGYLPYAIWDKPTNRFDLRRQNAYAAELLGQLGGGRLAVRVLSLLKAPGQPALPALPGPLAAEVEAVAYRDTQYTLQTEAVDLRSALYRLRLERNRQAAAAALQIWSTQRPDVVILPNGTIFEFGALYQTAQFLGIPVTTYEFGEQGERIWLAQNAEVMRQDTSALWEARRDLPLAESQLDQVRRLFAARQRASLWENFARRWQGAPSAGGAQARASLQLTADRPVVLLATNVIGDSLTLGRQVFSDSMTEWLERTVRYFAARPDVQFVIRIHPGELITKGPSVADVVLRAMQASSPAALPPHIHLVPADASLNTYDLVEIADLGLVYTTTVGMEMAMSGVPVLAVGNTHYRGRGFTLDPLTWDDYFALLERVLHTPADFRLTKAQVELAWQYAYRFFFEYPLPFPWHVVHIWDDITTWSMARVLSAEGQALFGPTWQYLTGQPLDWAALATTHPARNIP